MVPAISNGLGGFPLHINKAKVFETNRLLKLLALCLGCGLFVPLLPANATYPASPVQRVEFARDIQPIIAAHCAQCHGAQKQMAQLRLDQKQTALKVITPGNSEESRLLQRIRGDGGKCVAGLHHVFVAFVRDSARSSTGSSSRSAASER